MRHGALGAESSTTSHLTLAKPHTLKPTCLKSLAPTPGPFWGPSAELEGMPEILDLNNSHSLLTWIRQCRVNGRVLGSVAVHTPLLPFAHLLIQGI